MKRVYLQRLIAIVVLMAALASCSSSTYPTSANRVSEIKRRGTLLVGATGDYRPLSYLEPQTNEYWGFDVELANIIARRLGVNLRFVPTSWPTLTQDVLSGERFDLAMCGITINDARKDLMLMSEGYLRNGKTIMCRKTDAERYSSLADINQPHVRVMINPGGTNEKFALENLTKAQIIVHHRNEEIPALIAEGKADIMITEIVEASYYTQIDQRLAAPLIEKPFTRSLMGVLMCKANGKLLKRVNHIIEQCKRDGTLRRLHEKYGFKYNF